MPVWERPLPKPKPLPSPKQHKPPTDGEPPRWVSRLSKVEVGPFVPPEQPTDPHYHKHQLRGGCTCKCASPPPPHLPPIAHLRRSRHLAL